MKAVYQLSDNIISSLGFTTEENYNAVLAGKSGLTHYSGHTFGVAEPFFASLIDTQLLDNEFSKISQQQVSRFEKLAILSVYNATRKVDIKLDSEKTLFVLSTTKGNVGLLEQSNAPDFQQDQLLLHHSASVIARFFGNRNVPIVISNACISGVSALIVAKRMLQTEKYTHAVVVGADVLSKFIVSGFQSFKALSEERCKPFDANRAGLNLGEGAATMVLGVSNGENFVSQGSILLQDGAITNDANHISGPSRTGEGLYLALKTLLQTHNTNDIGFVNAHGTATPYNDEMESIALTRAGLKAVPVNSFKAYFGHTLGAAGVLETVISSVSLKRNQLIKSIGYDTCGVTHPLNIITQTCSAEISGCIKMVSGFGGCNAAVLLKKID